MALLLRPDNRVRRSDLRCANHGKRGDEHAIGPRKFRGERHAGVFSRFSRLTISRTWWGSTPSAGDFITLTTTSRTLRPGKAARHDQHEHRRFFQWRRIVHFAESIHPDRSGAGLQTRHFRRLCRGRLEAFGSAYRQFRTASRAFCGWRLRPALWVRSWAPTVLRSSSR